MPGDFIINGEAFSDVVQCFDLISMGDKPYIDRYHGLHKLIAQGDASTMCIYTAWSTYEKKTLYAKLIAENAEGIVFKRITSLYSPGRPSSGGNQLKFKFCATATVIAGHLNTGKRSVQMFMKDGGVLIPVGNVTIYPNQEIPEVNSFMEIKYLYAYPGGSLFQPVFLKLRTDCDENDCKIEQLKYKQVVA
jgi:bifunctional non-homologous end joining protein LigD